MIKQLNQFLSGFMTEKRYEVMTRNLNLRTRYVTVLLEDIFQSQNASAVLRTCDCLGIQDVHVVENWNFYNLNPDVSLGSQHWINLHRYNSKGNNTEKAIQYLKNNGYRIIATVPAGKAVSLEDFDLTRGKVALAFGSEHKGLSEYLLKHADEFMTIPMVGFTESFNISVSAGVILYKLTQELRKSNLSWPLSEDEKEQILHHWLKRSVKMSGKLIKKFYEENQP